MSRFAAVSERYAFYALVAYVFFAPFKRLNAAGEIFFGLTTLLLVLNLIASRGEKLKRLWLPVGRAWLIWVLFSFLSLITAIDVLYSLNEIRIDILKPTIVGAAALMYVDDERLKYIFSAILASSFVMALSGVVEYLLYIHGSGLSQALHNIGGYRVSGLGRYIHDYMTFILIGIPYWFCLAFLYKKNTRYFSIAILGAVFLIMGNILGFGRMQLVAMSIACITLGLLLHFKWYKMLLIALIAIVLVFTLTPRSFVETKAGNAMTLPQTEERFPLMKVAFDHIKAHPFAGIGFGYSGLSKMDKSYLTTDPAHPVNVHLHPHNYYVVVWLGMGLQGLLAFMYLLFQISRSLWPPKNLPDPPALVDLFPLATLSMLAGLLIVNLTDTLLVTRVLMLTIVLIGSAIGAKNKPEYLKAPV